MEQVQIPPAKISTVQPFYGLTKKDIKIQAQNAVNSVLYYGNPLQIAEAVSAMEAFTKEIRDNVDFKDYVREETAKYGKGYTSPSGAKIELAETGSSYDFSQCNDPELTELEQMLMSAKDAVDKRKAFLKTVPAIGMDVRYRDELITVYPPSKTSTSSYKVTLAR